MIETLAQTLLPVASWVGFATLKSLIVIPLVLVMRRLCARWLTPQGRYGLWFAVVACLSIPFGAQMEINREAQAVEPAIVRIVSPSTTAKHELPIISVDPAPAATYPTLSMTSTAILVWLLGMTSLAGAVVYNVHRYRRIRYGASEVGAATGELFQHCKQTLGIHRHVRLLETSQIPSPVVVGYWRPTLLLPRTLSAQVSNEQLRLVLLHELTHVRRHDILVNWVVTLVQIAHWFNPLAWYAMRILRNDMEQACDAGVLRHLSSREQCEYGDTLIRLSDLVPQRTLLVQNASVVESPSQLKSRISMIAQFKPRGVFSSVLAAALIVLTSSIAITQAASAPQPPTSSATRPAPPAAGAQATPAPEGKAAPRSAPVVETKKAIAERPTNAREKKAADAPVLESAMFPLRHAWAKDLVTFIKSAPGIGLLSDQSSIAVDEKANTLFVQDTASNVATIRQLVAKLDIPVQTVVVSAVFALVDSDLLRELTTGKVPGGAWSPVTDLGSEQTITAALIAGEQAHRAEIISSPQIVVANHAQATMTQSAGVPFPILGPMAKDMNMTLRVTPTVMPDNRVTLDIVVDVAIVGGMVVVVAGNPPVPSVDSRQVKNQVQLDSGATVMLDVIEGRAGKGTGAGPERRLVAFITPKRISEAVAR